ncbi:MAG TPA: penicillin acylase family protein, partial [Woeseiaceae bacterium]|nr:penicillin acylase family protein [Woeseiaceae bacterium]
WPAFSPLIGGTNEEQSLRTRSGLRSIRERLAGEDGIAAHKRIGLAEVQAMLFANRNYAAELVLDDLLALCKDTAGDAIRRGCEVLAAWDRRNDLGSRGDQLFREWWRAARRIENVWRVPFDPDRPEATPSGLNTDDPAVRSQLLAALDAAVAVVRAAGFELDAPLGDVQHKTLRGDPIGLHGGPGLEGLLNKVEAVGSGGLTPRGYEINFGTSYVQTVTFDERGPIAEAIMTYGQSTLADSPYAFDQLPLYAKEQWLHLPFRPDDVRAATVGEPLELTRP